jgi:hypothetical protein
MTLEQQVCSIELARKLRELGVKQTSFFYWKTRDLGSSRPHLVARNSPFVISQGIIQASAFTVAELGEMLPKEYRSHKSFEPQPASDEIWVIDGKADGLFYAATEADARAKMLVYLIENKLIPIP